MPIAVLMPALSPTMTEGKLAAWKKREGEPVKPGDVLAEIETDKATMEVEAVDEGTLGKILVPAGSEGVKVNTTIALLLAEGEDRSALAGAESKATPAAAPAPSAPAPSAAPAAKAPQAAPPGPARPAPKAAGRVFASPIARRMAAQAGLDVATIVGSGPQGRVVKADVEAALARRAEAPAAPARAAPAAGAPAAGAFRPAAYRVVPHTTMRKVIARRLTEAKQQVPHFYLTIDCDVDALRTAREAMNARAPEGEGNFKLSLNDLVIKAAAVALRRVPAANAAWSDEGTLLYDDVDISVAVATPGGLITPIVRDADRKGLAELSNEVKALAARARDGKLKPEEFQGGTFSISNLGMFGVREFAAVINPPQACILAVGAAEQRPVAKNGALALATMMTCTLSVDHRSVDGAVGARFLQEFKAIVENPLMMLL